MSNLIPKAWTDAIAAKPAVGVWSRYVLRHQTQEYTDTTAAYEAGEDVIPGDCWRACLGSLLEVPLDEVPHFLHLYSTPDNADRDDPLGPRWWLESVAWVEQQRPGWTIRAWEREGFPFPFYVAADAVEAAPDRVIVTGPSPRGPWQHSALYYAATGELEHDPFPGGQGVLDGPGDVVALVREEWL